MASRNCTTPRLTTNAGRTSVAVAFVATGILGLSQAAHAANGFELGLSGFASSALTAEQRELLRLTGEVIQRTPNTYGGVEVIGGETIARHTLSDGAEVLRSFQPTFDLDTTPTISTAEADQLARSFASEGTSSAAELKVLPPIAGEAARLTYWVRTAGQNGGHEAVLDAHTGELVALLPMELQIAPKLAPVTVLNAKDKDPVDPGGAPLEMNIEKYVPVILKGKKMMTLDESATRAGNNAARVLSYYGKVHGRNSFDGKGSELVSIVHVGKNFANAFWRRDVNVMAYGDGNPEQGALDLTIGTDVAGHEMTHGVIASTANLVYMSESGALNEALADLFGKLIERKGDWRIGSTIFTSQRNGKGIRDLKDPGSMTFNRMDPKTGKPVAAKYPSNVREKLPQPKGACTPQTNDNCWVHINSTIIGHAGYLMTESLGLEKTEKLLYRVLTTALTASSDFASFALSVRNVCKTGLSAADCSKADQALRAVGL